MSKRPDRGPEELEAELAAVSAALKEARAEIATLRAGGGADPDLREAVVALDAGARVVSVDAWPWDHPPPRVGERFADLFDPRSAVDVARASELGWRGVGALRLTLRSKAVVHLVARPEGEGFRIGVSDVTASAVMDQANEQRRRMHAVSQLAGTLARELTDPMSIVQGRLELLLVLGVDDPETVRKHLSVALEHSRRVTATLRNLRLVGRVAEPPSEPVPFRQVVEEVLDLLGPRATRVQLQVPADLTIGCDAALTARVCASLARQALEVTPQRVPIQLSAKSTRNGVVVGIGATGRGAAEIAEGDELSLDRTLLASVGGTLAARRAGPATRFEVTLPLGMRPRGRRRGERGRILVVGPSLRPAIPTLLERDGYEFVHATTADQAMTHLEQAPCKAVIAELLLEGGASGLLLAKLIAARFDQTRVIMVTEGDDLPALPHPVVPVRWPASRAELLFALGDRVRH